MKIGDFEATLMHARVGDTTVALWRVAELARHVDRAALLAADEAPEPPYWAHLWSGAVVLAAAVPRGARRVLELGSGLGLPGVAAARRGARVTFVDRVPAAFAFVRASARANGLAAVDLVAADATAPALAARFDLVLAAELSTTGPLFRRSPARWPGTSPPAGAPSSPTRGASTRAPSTPSWTGPASPGKRAGSRCARRACRSPSSWSRSPPAARVRRRCTSRSS